MQGIRSRITCLILLLSLFLNSFVLAAGERHWVYDELAEFKQHLLQYQASVSREEWMSVHSMVLSEDALDNPIRIWNWATLLKMILVSGEGKSPELLDMYVYGLSNGREIYREDAAGGLVKLLTLKYVSGSGTADDLKPSLELEDLEMISDRQRVLVQMAYCEGILDSQTKNRFRPQAYLTNGEAVSILNRVINKYQIKKEHTGGMHWAQKGFGMLTGTLKEGEPRFYIMKEITSSVMLDQPIGIKQWNELVLTTLNLKNGKYAVEFLEGYTMGLADKGQIKRDRAVAGLVKLLHAAELLKGRDARAEEIEKLRSCFSDVLKVFDVSKLAIAFSEGLIGGYGDGTFRPDQELTNAEALILLNRVYEKYISKP